ncbi:MULTISPECIES: hypothetical protein [unclassified Bradyrhizobium]|uniref:hypothetical protein n=1 Tax=unclassified Bradyrhizobium TaxID=2631580 RepID=UPI00247A9BCD|nr:MULTISPECIES: hypothetical protein [unclassified Bradyrhizobium]WGR71697.1 hypothetical protein MTX24_01625 [Bradyrhizobium sp. ISRA426]WGR76532.1 hypothetical protein MTX21_26575 [Bradyrhizobium sp. ISRA430]WGR86937.1 hypothetical protein MTX25_01625 [Bradyrhizobium sp. ISRA432]
MRRSDLAAILFLMSGIIPVTASAQQTTSDTNQSTSQAGPERPAQQSGQSQAQDTPTQPERTPQQSDQSRDRDRRNAEDTRINRDWTARQRGEDRMDMDRMRQRQGRMMDQDEDHRTTGRNWRQDDDDMDRGRRYGSVDRSEGRYYEVRPRPRVKTCIEYENGDEFCRYRD